MKIKRSNLIILATIFVLAATVGIFAYLNTEGEKPQEDRITLKAGNTVLGEVTIDDLRKLPSEKKILRINSTKGLTRHEFTATPLLGVLNQVDPQIVSKYTKIYTKGADNYVSGVNMAEVLEEYNVYIAFEDYGKPLPNSTGTGGTTQLLILNDEFGQRYTNYLVELQFE